MPFQHPSSYQPRIANHQSQLIVHHSVPLDALVVHVYHLMQHGMYPLLLIVFLCVLQPDYVLEDARLAVYEDEER